MSIPAPIPIACLALGERISAAFFGSGGEQHASEESRARAAKVLGLTPNRLLTVHQTHSPHVLTVADLHNNDNPPHADAMVTGETETGLTILTADCAPVLLADEMAGVIGAAHAGWKGALGGVLENTVAAMEALGAETNRIKAAIGPTISQANYEVGAEFKERFVTDDPANARFFVPSRKDGHFQFDLPAYCTARLEARGIADIQAPTHCTYADENRLFSYRRATHHGEADYGRNISVIVLRA